MDDRPIKPDLDGRKGESLPFPSEGELSVMMEVNVTLEFTCGGCDQQVAVTVHCTGNNLDQSKGKALATVNVPCPTCGQVNQLYFEPNGTICSVRPYAYFRVVPEPSVN